MAIVNHLKLLEEEVRMLKGRLAIETEERISDPERGRIFDPLDSMFDVSLPHILQSDGWPEDTGVSPVSRAPTLEAPGFRFLCCCPRAVSFRTKERCRGSFGQEGICLLMSNPCEPW